MIAESNYRLQVTIPLDLFLLFEQVCAESNLRKSDVIEQMIKTYVYGRSESNASQSEVL